MIDILNLVYGFTKIIVINTLGYMLQVVLTAVPWKRLGVHFDFAEPRLQRLKYNDKCYQNE